MNTQPWTQVKAFLADALEHDPDERAAFLDRVCGDDPGLSAVVQTLLDAYERATAEQVFNIPFLGSKARPGPELPPISSRVGPYRLVRELGHGGMDTVYLAERADGQFEKQVAVKFVRHGVGSEALRRRFRAERQILASLKHPNIARLLDGGFTEDGLPYLVMEYVEGLPLDAYCDTYCFSISERLHLFRTVCAALHYAHQNLIVHRDLKPSNILVTVEGRVMNTVCRLLKPNEHFNVSLIFTTPGANPKRWPATALC